jgi:hypothetical protein
MVLSLLLSSFLSFPLFFDSFHVFSSFLIVIFDPLPKNYLVFDLFFTFLLFHLLSLFLYIKLTFISIKDAEKRPYSDVGTIKARGSSTFEAAAAAAADRSQAGMSDSTLVMKPPTQRRGSVTEFSNRPLPVVPQRAAEAGDAPAPMKAPARPLPSVPGKPTPVPTPVPAPAAAPSAVDARRTTLASSGNYRSAGDLPRPPVSSSTPATSAQGSVTPPASRMSFGTSYTSSNTFS